MEVATRLASRVVEMGAWLVSKGWPLANTAFATVLLVELVPDTSGAAGVGMPGGN